MDKKEYTFRHIGPDETAAIRELFFSVFTAPPWNDDWSDSEQLDLYLQDLIGQNNSLTYGLYAGEKLIGVSMGHIKHWYTGVEYCVDEFCILAEKQGQGLGTLFLREMEKEIGKLGITQVFLQTEATVPAYHFYLKNGFAEMKGHVSFVKRL
ncbi:MAG: GNAT family N-acetyltransferase [Clostridia bacterium]|nr:GNAT family N-acetyltransferase [Clostridia bacterium]